MFTRKLFFGIGLLIVGLSIGCAAPAPAPSLPPMTALAAPRAAEAPKPTVVGAAAQASQPMQPGTGSSANVPAPVVDARRKIIKNAQFLVTVESADTAVDRLTGIAGDMGGYITSSRTFFEGGLKAATMTFAVPVDRFEGTLRRVRGIALKVEQESASGQDVTDQYVDLESQLRNLEATADRIRDFLKKAQTVEEALKVNQQLSQVEKDIETIKGKLNYLDDRSAFSTLTVEVREPKPTPTPTFTPAPTATPTPANWRPDQTLKQAVETQTTLARALIDLLIWLVVVLLPYALLAAAAIWVIARIQRWLGRNTPGGPSQSPPTAGVS